MQICSQLHQRYADFAEDIVGALAKNIIAKGKAPSIVAKSSIAATYGQDVEAVAHGNIIYQTYSMIFA